MKSFKQFLVEAKPSYNKWKSKGLSWDQSPLLFSSSFGELRFKKLVESIDDWLKNTSDSPNQIKLNEYGKKYNSAIHDHDDYHSNNLKDNERKFIHSYTSASAHSSRGHGSSENMNAMLRNMSGDKSSKILNQKKEDVYSSIKNLSSCFRKDTTNRKIITTWGGIPKHVGEHLMKSGEGSEHHLPGFTSTSTDRAVALYFAGKYNDPKDYESFMSTPLHVVQYHIHPGAGLSAARHSPHDENEVILHHGTKVTYHGHKKITLPNGRTIILHHVTAHPEHKSLDQYGEYHHP